MRSASVWARRARGKGYGTDALRVLVRFAFERRNLRRVHLVTLASNAGGLACYRKVGFVEEGRRREHAWVRGGYAGRGADGPAAFGLGDELAGRQTARAWRSTGLTAPHRIDPHARLAVIAPFEVAVDQLEDLVAAVTKRRASSPTPAAQTPDRQSACCSSCCDCAVVRCVLFDQRRVHRELDDVSHLMTERRGEPVHDVGGRRRGAQQPDDRASVT